MLFHPQGQRGWGGKEIQLRLPPQSNQANTNQVHDQNENNPGLVQAPRNGERQGRGKQKYVSEVGYVLLSGLG